MSVLALDGPRLYVGGAFNQANGSGASSVIAVDRSSGVLLGFRPEFHPDEPDARRPVITSILPVGDKVFVGGRFVRVGDVFRDDLVQLRADDGKPTTWSGAIQRSLTARGSVNALAVAGDTLYVGGLFFAAGGNGDTRNLAALPFAQRNPSLSGEVRVGSTLTCDPGTWTIVMRPLEIRWMLRDPASGVLAEAPGATSTTYTIRSETGLLPFSFGFQWLRDATAIPGATGSRHTVVAADAGHAIACRVTNTNPGGVASATSAATMR